MINLEDYLSIVAAYIRRDGYVKSGYEESTWKKALVRYETPIKSDNIQPTRKDEQIAQQSIGYFLNQKNSQNDYVDRVRAILSNSVKSNYEIEQKDLPFVASAVQSYLRNEEYRKKKEQEQEQRDQEARNSNYIGEIGDKITVQIAQMFYKVIDGPYGESIMYKFVDKFGNIFIWFTGKNVPDGITEITGIIKAHNEFRGVKQTVLTRCKFK